jgi:anti-anti-sigma factor
VVVSRLCLATKDFRSLRGEMVLMSFATRKRRITAREANRLPTSRASSDGRHRPGSGRAVDVAGPEPFAVEVQQRDAVAIVQPRGELDLVTVEMLRAALDGIRSPERLVVDLRGLSFMGSTGLQLLVALHQRAQREGWQLTLVAPAAPVDRATQLCGLDTELPFVAVADTEPGESASSPQGEARARSLRSGQSRAWNTKLQRQRSVT